MSDASVTPPRGPAGLRATRLALLGVAVAVGAAFALAVSGIGYRAGWWPLPTAFTIFRWAAYAGAAGAVVSLAAAVMGRRVRRAFALGLVGVLVGGVAAVLPWQWQQTARSVPPIHDITTDLEDPPGFVAVLPLRANARNAAVHGGATVAAAQRRGYPDLVPAMLGLPRDEAFAAAEQAARAMGWEIVAVEPGQGLIEATDTTRWFGFKDDVVIRVREQAGGSRVDMRSVSRVGGSDVGTNAGRIRAYMTRLGDAAAARGAGGG